VRAKASITPMPEWGPGRARIEVNGHDISNAVSGMDLRLRPGEIPELNLDLRVLDVSSVDSAEVEVFIPSQVHDALVKLGWSPPQEEA
jgi:hypothetical protein